MELFLKILLGAFLSTIIAVLAFFFSRLVKKSDEADIENKKSVKELDTKVNNLNNDLTNSFQSNFTILQDRVGEVKGDLAIIKVKQENFSLLSNELKTIHSTLSRQVDSIFIIKEETSKSRKEIQDLWDYVRKLEISKIVRNDDIAPLERPDISKYLSSDLFTEREKQNISKFVNYARHKRQWEMKDLLERIEKVFLEKQSKEEDPFQDELKSLEEQGIKVVDEPEFEDEREIINEFNDYKLEDSDNNPTYRKISSTLKKKD